MNFQRMATTVLFLLFLALSIMELAPKWQEAARRETDAVLYVRSLQKQPPPNTKKKAISFDSLLKANSKNRDG